MGFALMWLIRLTSTSSIAPSTSVVLDMKKEAVSRCLKSLYEKNCICKERQAADERSYQLFMTETGLAELKMGYESILQPFYDLWRSSGEDFEAFMYYAERLAAHIEKGQDKTRDHEIL